MTESPRTSTSNAPWGVLDLRWGREASCGGGSGLSCSCSRAGNGVFSGEGPRWPTLTRKSLPKAKPLSPQTRDRPAVLLRNTRAFFVSQKGSSTPLLHCTTGVISAKGARWAIWSGRHELDFSPAARVCGPALLVLPLPPPPLCEPRPTTANGSDKDGHEGNARREWPRTPEPPRRTRKGAPPSAAAVAAAVITTRRRELYGDRRCERGRGSPGRGGGRRRGADAKQADTELVGEPV